MKKFVLRTFMAFSIIFIFLFCSTMLIEYFAVASLPPPSGPPAPAPVLYLMKKTRPPLVIP